MGVRASKLTPFKLSSRRPEYRNTTSYEVMVERVRVRVRVSGMDKAGAAGTIRVRVRVGLGWEGFCDCEGHGQRWGEVEERLIRVRVRVIVRTLSF